MNIPEEYKWTTIMLECGHCRLQHTQERRPTRMTSAAVTVHQVYIREVQLFTAILLECKKCGILLEIGAPLIQLVYLVSKGRIRKGAVYVNKLFSTLPYTDRQYWEGDVLPHESVLGEMSRLRKLAPHRGE